MASKALNQMIFDADWGELDFWAELGVLHKIAAVNGYVLCSHARHNCCEHGHAEHTGSGHSAFILVCTECGAVDEQSLSRQWGDLQQAVADTGFSLTEKHLVLTGIDRQLGLGGQHVGDLRVRLGAAPHDARRSGHCATRGCKRAGHG